MRDICEKIFNVASVLSFIACIVGIVAFLIYNNFLVMTIGIVVAVMVAAKLLINGFGIAIDWILDRIDSRF